MCSSRLLPLAVYLVLFAKPFLLSAFLCLMSLVSLTQTTQSRFKMLLLLQASSVKKILAYTEGPQSIRVSTLGFEFLQSSRNSYDCFYAVGCLEIRSPPHPRTPSPLIFLLCSVLEPFESVRGALLQNLGPVWFLL